MPRTRDLLRTLGVLAAAVAGALGGVLGSFVHRATVFGLPAGLLLGAAVTVAVLGGAGLVLGRPGAAAGAVGWVAAVLTLASPRPEGDLVVDGSAFGYGWLFGGTVLAGTVVLVPWQRVARQARRTRRPPYL